MIDYVPNLLQPPKTLLDAKDSQAATPHPVTATAVIVQLLTEPTQMRTSCQAIQKQCISQWTVAGSEAREEDRVHSVGSGHAVLGQGEPSIHLPLSVNLPVVDL